MTIAKNFEKENARLRSQVQLLYGVLNSVRVAAKHGKFLGIVDLEPRMNQVLLEVERDDMEQGALFDNKLDLETERARKLANDHYEQGGKDMF